MLATLEDYSARYGGVAAADEARVTTLLADASAMLLAAYERLWGDYFPGAHPTFDRSAAAVCCLVVNRVLNAPAALAGATQYSQGAGSYTATVTYGGSLGEMYLGKSDLKRLGLSGARIVEITPEVRDG